ncbi:hypothetical protein ACIPSJ_01540 [Streptomyces sp. NPDC090088]|uniref:hypothetical protein n=1 Tax=Streptomyces sp. NPDC090088 TaxID=3365944 RepID=UPI0038128C5E
MPRLQILELPTEHHGDDMSTPYLLVVDEAPHDPAARAAFLQDLKDHDLVARTGARAVLCFESTMELPANQVVAGEQAYPVAFQVLPDFTEFRAQVASELQTTQQRLAEGQVRVAAQHVTPAKTDAEHRNSIADLLVARAQEDRHNFTCLDTIDEVAAWLREEQG